MRIETFVIPWSLPFFLVTGCGHTTDVGSSPTSVVGENPTSDVGGNPTSVVGGNPTSDVGENPTSVAGKKPISDVEARPTPVDLSKPKNVTQVVKPLTSCDIRAFSRPNVALTILSETGEKVISGSTHGIIFHIVGQQADMFRFDQIEALTDEGRKYPQQGWVAVSDTSINLNMSEVSPALHPPHPIPLYENALGEGKPLHSFHQETVTTELVGCRGDAVNVVVHFNKREELGWLRWGSHCGNPVTTCPTM